MPPNATTVIYNGRERVLAELCREAGIDRQTVAYRLAKGMSIEAALMLPPRKYPQTKRTRKPAPEPQLEKPPPPSEGLVADAIDLMVDARAVISALEGSPRRTRIVEQISRWLLRAGWR